MMKKVISIYYFFLFFIQKKIYKKNTVAIKHPAVTEVEDKAIRGAARAISSNFNFFATQIPRDFWYGRHNDLIDITVLYRGKDVYVLNYRHRNYIWLQEKSVSDIELSMYDFAFRSENEGEQKQIQEIAEKVISDQKEREWQGYKERLQTHHFCSERSL